MGQNVLHLVKDIGGNPIRIAIGSHRCNAPCGVEIGCTVERVIPGLIPERVASGIVTGDSDGQKDGWFVTAFVRTVIGGNAKLKVSDEGSDFGVEGMIHGMMG